MLPQKSEGEMATGDREVRKEGRNGDKRAKLEVKMPRIPAPPDSDVTHRSSSPLSM